MTAIALLSDIHANLPALEAIIAAVQTQQPDAVYVLGDMVNGCPWPAEVLDRLRDLGWPMLLGNHDDAVLQLGTSRMEPRYHDRQRYATLWWTRACLADRHLAALTALPLEYRLAPPDAPPLRLLHGLPGNFFNGFRPDTPATWAAQQLAAVPEATVAGGHTHVPMVRPIPRSDAAPTGQEWLVINSGSVGAPYDGDPRPSYAWLLGTPDGWQATIRRVVYDRDALARSYRASSLADAGGALGEMFLRSVLTGLPWVADFAWWLRQQFGDGPVDTRAALRRYDTAHGPGRWAFPLVT